MESLLGDQHMIQDSEWGSLWPKECRLLTRVKDPIGIHLQINICNQKAYHWRENDRLQLTPLVKISTAYFWVVTNETFPWIVRVGSTSSENLCWVTHTWQLRIKLLQFLKGSQWGFHFPYLLQWVMIYSFGINTNFGNKSQFYPSQWTQELCMKIVWKRLHCNWVLSNSKFQNYSGIWLVSLWINHKVTQIRSRLIPWLVVLLTLCVVVFLVDDVIFFTVKNVYCDHLVCTTCTVT